MSDKSTAFDGRHSALVAALSKTVEIFTEHSEDVLDELMGSGLRPAADAAGLDRIVIYQFTDGGAELEQTYVWAFGKTGVLDRGLINTPMIPPVRRWVNILSRGECVNGNVSDMPQDSADYLSRYGVKAIFMVPIFIKGSFWGIVTLEDHTRYRYFDESAHTLLKSVAQLCANAFVKGEMERRITEANEYNRVLLAAAPIGLTIFGKGLRIIDCNDAIVKLLKTTRERYVSHFRKFLPERQPDGSNSVEKMADAIERALHGETLVMEWYHVSERGECIPFEITLTRVRRGNRFVVLAYKYDLTNIRKMEEMASDAEELTRLVTEASPFPYVLFGDTFNVVDCNNAAMKLFKCNDKQYIREHYWDVFLPRCQDDGQESYAKASASIAETPMGEWDVYEWIQRTVDGELVPVENTLTPVIHKGKRIAVAFKYDLRNTKMLMENIRQKSEQLEEALERATAASNAKGVFLSNMSHEMRTPLNTITGMASIGKNSPDAERKDYALTKIEEASSLLLGVINDVLDMSKIEANKLELVMADFSFESTVKKTVNAIYFRMEQKKQTFRVMIDGKIPGILVGDDQRLTQVMLNLLSNAAKFTPEGGDISLDARLGGEENGVSTISVEVRDSGIGIAPEQRDRIFKAFEQADSGTSRRFGGTGLGLVISKRIVEMMGGEISVESAQGQGSVFRFTFRAARGSETPVSSLDPSVNWGNMRAIAVDDDEGTLAYFREIFKNYGVECDIAQSGGEALGLIGARGGYDIYFVDWKMPGMDGIELIKRIKGLGAERKHDRSAVIMMSAAEWGLIRGEAEGAGVNKFLMKPIFASDIVDCLNVCLGASERDAPIQRKAAAAGEFKGCRILLAEDVEINREILLALMEDTDAEIECAENGIEALRLIGGEPGKYDLIFMDIQMPSMDGMAATRLIRAFDAATPIIAMTANVFREDIEKCLAAGMDDHLGKPLDINEVLKKVRKYWKGYGKRGCKAGKGMQLP